MVSADTSRLRIVNLYWLYADNRIGIDPVTDLWWKVKQVSHLGLHQSALIARYAGRRRAYSAIQYGYSAGLKMYSLLLLCKMLQAERSPGC